ncbi:MAG: glycosyltransferase family 4 protein [Acidobacteria bacterium]|nr:glycosyltransferase family 4 protein [Acidobacteriota bacterium]MCW5949121.1 glycosyltransferase family 4 protein [Pyrinomonadaceae bacterium]
MPTKVLFVERKRSSFVSLEKVFRLVASALDPERFAASFAQMPFSNDLVSVVRNLLFFRPEQADVYHVTGHVHYIVFRLPVERTILTIHDLAFLHTRKGLRRFMLKKILLDWPLRRTRYVTAVSEATRDEIVSFLPQFEGKIRVIDNPLDPSLTPLARSAFRSERPVILQVGTMKHKNVVNLINALDGIECELRIVGDPDPEIIEAASRVSLHVEFLRQLDDRAMSEAYLDADIVAFCSTYEGFGLPIIEAQAVGTPVITSNLRPMSDVAGEGAMLVNPHDPNSIREGIIRIINDEALRTSLVEAGYKNIDRFRSDRVADRYMKLYDKVNQSLETYQMLH